MDKTRIIQADRSHCTLLSALGAETFIETFGPHNTKEDMEEYVAKSFSHQQVETELKEPGSVFFIAYSVPQRRRLPGWKESRPLSCNAFM